MTAPFYDTPPRKRSDPHDQVFQDLRDNGLGPAPADITRVARSHVPVSSAKAMGKQFARGLAESGLGALELLGRASDVFTGKLPQDPTSGYATVERLLAHTREQVDNYYGTPATDEEAAANLVGNLVGSSATGALGEGVARPIQGALSELRAASAPFRLVPAVTPRSTLKGFEPTTVLGTGGFSEYNYNIVNNATGEAVGSLHGGLENQGKTFFVDLVSANKGGRAFSSGVGKLGTRATRDLLRQLQEFHPGVAEIAGERATGAKGTAIGSMLARNQRVPENLLDITRIPLTPVPEGPLPTFRKIPAALERDLTRIMREERGSFKWGENPQPVPPERMSGKDFDELLNRAYLGRPTGPLVHPATEVLPALPEMSPRGNRLLVTDEMMARGRARKTGIGRFSQDLARNETRQANNMLREAIMRNENPLGFESPLSGRAPKDRLRIVDIRRFLQGISKQ